MQLLYEYFSIPKCLLATERHMRLCRQVQGGPKYEQAIQSAYNSLQTKYSLLQAADRNVYVAHDSVCLLDNMLDDLLVKAHHRCHDYDNAHLGSFTRTTVFPNGNYGETIEMNIYKEPDRALEIAFKVESLGETHELFPLAAEIRTAVTASKKAITDEEAAIKVAGLARADAEISKLQLIRRYNSNFFQAADEGGKKFAENLFPDLSSPSKKEPETPPQEVN